MRARGTQGICSALIIVLFAGPALAGPTDAEKCESTKNKIAGKYALCRTKAEARAIKKNIAPDFTKCDSKLDKKWAKAELPAACLDIVSVTAIRDFVTAQTDVIAGALAVSGALPECGDDLVNLAGEQCDGLDLDGYSCESLGHLSGILSCDASCDFDISGCADCDSLGGAGVGGFCWFLGAADTDCDATCASAGLSYSTATLSYSGSDGTLAQCYDVLDALGQTSPPFADAGDFDCLSNPSVGVSGIGCAVTGPGFPLRLRCMATTTVASANHPDISRACACE